MSYDPYHYPDAPGSGLAAVKAKTTSPAVALLIVSVLNLLAGLYFLFNGFVVSRMPMEEFEKQIKNQPQQQQDEMRRQGYTPEVIRSFAVNGCYGEGAVALVASLLTLLGSVRMLMLKSYGLAVFSSVLMAVPCVSPFACCLLGMGIGIWSLVVLFQPDVRAAFNREGRGGAPDYGDDPDRGPGPERFTRPGPPYPDRPPEPPPYDRPGPNG